MKKSSLKAYLRKSHQEVSHRKRIEILSDILATNMSSLSNHSLWNCLDIGCGDMKISSLISQKASQINFKCIDVFPKPENRIDINWDNYLQYDGVQIPYEQNSFDAAILVDVLHHCTDITGTLNEARRITPYIIVKDHLEYGLVSRTLLQLMDFYGNWAYDVNVPKRYFSKESFEKLCKECGFKILSMQIGINLYKTLPLIARITKPEWQFIAVLEREQID
ncbi:class I SAM-dependent methyltransferase [Pedobacter sp. GR22-6]|uniref:class I SAM-dependent methyltransferase n=1 Tax=Pedobacter sp. GR22-6 TaxID=3127957 RepID=UPI00307E1617